MNVGEPVEVFWTNGNRNTGRIAAVRSRSAVIDFGGQQTGIPKSRFLRTGPNSWAVLVAVTTPAEARVIAKRGKI